MLSKKDQQSFDNVQLLLSSGVRNGEAVSRGAAPVLNNTVSTPQIDYQKELQNFENKQEFIFEKERKKWLLLDTLSSMSKHPGFHKSQKRVRHCMTCLVKGKEEVSIEKSTQSNKSRFSGLIRCELPWTCPNCSPLEANKRAKEANCAIYWANQQKKIGNPVLVFMVTLTMAHKKRDNCYTSVRDIKNALTEFTKNRKYRNNEYILGCIFSFEIVWTIQNGWHPHYHILFFIKTSTQKQGERILKPLSSVWKNSLKLQNRKMSSKYGFHISGGSEKSSNYISKFGSSEGFSFSKNVKSEDNLALEITQGHTKTSGAGITPWGILEKLTYRNQCYPDFDSVSEKQLFALYLEYTQAVSRLRIMTWSNGFKELIKLQEVMDHLYPDQEYDDDFLFFETVFLINKKDWYYLLKTTTRHDRSILLKETSLGASVDYLYDLLIELLNKSKFNLVKEEDRDLLFYSSLKQPIITKEQLNEKLSILNDTFDI